MKRLIRDFGRTLLIALLIACAAAIAGLGATVHVFTLQQTEVVDDSSLTLAVRHVYDYAANGVFLRESTVLNVLNEHPSVKVPALTKAYWCIDASVTPVYSENVEGTYYNWSRDDELARTVLTVTCTEDLGKDPYADVWYAMVKVDEVHLPLPYDIPEEIKIVGYTRSVANKQEPLVPGESYLLCGWYSDYVETTDYAASYAGGQFKQVYRKDRSQPPKLYLTGWNNSIKWMKYISTPDDTAWLEEAVGIGDRLNRSLRLDCINDLNRLRWFTNGQAMIIEGRSFTEEEMETGAKVCLISQELAQSNGLTIGDTISMTAYAATIDIQVDPIPDHLDMMYQTVDVRTAEGSRETFEIIGIYSAPLYTNTNDEFVPNTVIAPYNSMELDPGRGTILPIQTQNFIIHNGQGDVFLQAVRDAGYPDGLYTIEETKKEGARVLVRLTLARWIYYYLFIYFSNHARRKLRHWWSAHFHR